jgi:hypothetical protein
MIIKHVFEIGDIELCPIRPYHVEESHKDLVERCTFLFHVSKLWYEIGAPVFFGKNTFKFPGVRGWYVLTNFLATIGPAKAQMLKRLAVCAPKMASWPQAPAISFLEDFYSHECINQPFDIEPDSKLSLYTPHMDRQRPCLSHNCANWEFSPFCMSLLFPLLSTKRGLESLDLIMPPPAADSMPDRWDFRPVGYQHVEELTYPGSRRPDDKLVALYSVDSYNSAQQAGRLQSMLWYRIHLLIVDAVRQRASGARKYTKIRVIDGEYENPLVRSKHHDIQLHQHKYKIDWTITFLNCSVAGLNLTRGGHEWLKVRSQEGYNAKLYHWTGLKFCTTVELEDGDTVGSWPSKETCPYAICIV